jgi:integrase
MDNQTNFLAYMASVVSRLEGERRHGTAHVYRSTLKRIMEFEGRTSLAFGKVTPLWLKAFQDYLTGRQLSWNTISTYMRMLRAVYSRAVDDGLASWQPRLFKGVYTGTRVTVKRAVDEETFRKLEVPVEPSEPLERTRLLFLLLFMLRGIPFVDIAYMRRCDLRDGILTYRRRKTGAWLTVKVEPEAMDIIRRLQSRDEGSPYLFPFISCPGHGEYRQYSNALRRFNHRLKELALHMGIEALSSYSARHSWATIANYRNYQPELISNAMGHSSVKVTETYFKKHTDERIDEMNRGIISYVFTI